jgi:septal ring-binding cell division protein DamX
MVSNKLDKVNENQPVEATISSEKSLPAGLPDPMARWLQDKLNKSRDWLRQADPQKVSIQVMVRNQAAAKDLVNYLKNEWPLDLDKTQLFAVSKPSGDIFRVFYGEYPTITAGQQAIRGLPPEVQANAPYLHSIYRMQQMLL